MRLYGDWDLLQRVDVDLATIAAAQDVELPTAPQLRAKRVRELLYASDNGQTESDRLLPPSLRELSDRLFSDDDTTAGIHKQARRWVRRYPREITLDELTNEVRERLVCVIIQNAEKWFRLRGREADATWWGRVYHHISDQTKGPLIEDSRFLLAHHSTIKSGSSVIAAAILWSAAVTYHWTFSL